MTPSLPAKLPVALYSFLVTLLGVAALAALTQPASLEGNLGPLLFLTALSLLVKQAGVHVSPEINQSLVGIVDLAAILIFGALPGAWVPALSALLYLLIKSIYRGPRQFRTLVEGPFFTFGAKALTGIAVGLLYVGLGGPLPARDLDAVTAGPLAAGLLTWFLLDNLFWAIWEWLYRGWREFVPLFRGTFRLMLWVELIPLPFALVIAAAYSRFGGLTGGLFLILALGLVLAAAFVRRFADQQSRLARSSHELGILNEFGQEVARAGMDVERIKTLLADYARRLAPVRCARVELFDSTASPAQAFFQSNPQPRLAADLAQAGPPIPLQDLGLANDSGPAILAPLNASGQVIGLLTLTEAERALEPNDLRNVNALASEAAVVIQNARLFAAERRRAAQLALVSQVSQEVARFLDLDTLLRQIVEQIRERFGYSHVHVFLVDETSGLLHFRASTHAAGDAWRARREWLAFGQGLIGTAAALGEPVLVGDIRQDPRYLEPPDQSILDTRSELAAPLVVGERVVGVLDVQSTQVDGLTEEDLFVIKTLAAQMAIAVEDARLYTFQKEETWYLNTLLQVAENLSSAANRDEALETVVRITPLLVGVERCATFLYDENTRTFIAAKAYGLSREQQQAFQGLEFHVDDNPDSALARLLETRAHVVIEDASLPSSGSAVKTFQVRSALLVPLATRGRIVGAMVVDQGSQRRIFSDHEIQVVMGIANQAAASIENARLNLQAELTKRLEYEIGLARQIQSSLLPPSSPTVPGFDICPAWRVAREVGGDFYDFVELPGDRLGIVIADVSDKGMAAALFMALSRTLIRAMAFGKPGPSEALERSNDLIIADARSDMFVTAFYGILDPHEGRLYYANAGHNPPLYLRHATRELTTLPGHGMALGVKPHIVLPERAVTLYSGDVLLFYTDGVTDAIDGAEEEFGLDRLSAVVKQYAGGPAAQLIDEVLRAVTEFTGAATQFDDVTLVAVKRLN